MVGDVPSRRRRRRLAAAAAVLAVAAVLAGCADEAPQDTWQPAGDNAQKIHNLQWPVFAIAGVIGLIVMTTVVWVVYRYREVTEKEYKALKDVPEVQTGEAVFAFAKAQLAEGNIKLG